MQKPVKKPIVKKSVKKPTVKKSVKKSVKKPTVKKPTVKKPTVKKSVKKSVKKVNKIAECKRSKIGTIMKEFKEGKLKTSYGKKVTNRKQGIAIALSMANRYC